MSEINQVRLTGFVTKVYPKVITPAEVTVSRFLVEHSSYQVELGKKRLVKCKIFCISLTDDINESMLNRHVDLQGFISLNSQKQIILHITNIKNLD